MPVATSASDNSVTYNSTTNTNLSSSQVDVCIYRGSHCNGGGKGGLAIGGTTSFLETLTFGTTVPSLSFSGFYGKLQTSAGSVEGAALSGPRRRQSACLSPCPSRCSGQASPVLA